MDWARVAQRSTEQLLWEGHLRRHDVGERILVTVVDKCDSEETDKGLGGK